MTEHAADKNPLLTRTFRIPFDHIRAEHVAPAIDRLLADARSQIDALVANNSDLTYDSTLGALERATEPLEWASSVIGHLESVATYPEWRTAFQHVQPKISEFWSDVLLDERLWRMLTRFDATEAARQLTGTHKRHHTKAMDEFRRQGAELDPERKKRLGDINVELTELTARFGQNVLDSTNDFELIVEDEEKLAGLPDSAKEAAAEAARAKGHGGWRFTLQAPSYTPLITYLDDQATRELVWRAYNSRATTPDFDNHAISDRILKLRKEKAELLSYDDFADLVLEERMAGSGAVAGEFVRDIREKTFDFFQRENEELVAFHDKLAGNEPAMHPWDIAYYAEKQRAAVYDFDEEQLRPYFPVESVLDGLFKTVERLYGVVIQPDPDLPVWDRSVRTHKLVERDGTHLASFYIDLYPRENKRAGAWMDGFIVAVRPDAHLGLICANVNPPVGGKPALLTHREVETLFHEFGHLMHLCLSQVTVRSLAGTNVVWDFVELPSQIMENWCWEREALDLFARHYETGEPIPQDLFDKMVRTRTYRAANGQMRQIGYATVDLQLHREYDPAGDVDIATYSRKVFQQHHPASLPDDYGFMASFGHLFSSPVGYAAGYYSYKWAEVLDADAFTRFRDAGVFDRKVGEQFRQCILSQGDSKPPMELYKDFMGREPKLDPLLERQGLTRLS